MPHPLNEPSDTKQRRDYLRYLRLIDTCIGSSCVLYLTAQGPLTVLPESLLQRRESHDGNQLTLVNASVARAQPGLGRGSRKSFGRACHTGSVSVSPSSVQENPRTESVVLVVVIGGTQELPNGLDDSGHFEGRKRYID